MANITMTGPVPGDKVALSLRVEDGKTIVFTDGLLDSPNNFTYTFKNPVLLHQAFEMKCFHPTLPAASLPTFNNRLSRLGDAVLKVFCERQSMKNGEDGHAWNERFMYGISMNSYLAHRADILGVTNWLWKGDCLALELAPHLHPTTHERATAVEAVIGAVNVDSESDMAILQLLMRRLGVWWPTSPIEVDIMDDYIAQLTEMGIVGRRR